MEPRLVKIGEAARLLGTTPDTLRKWESTGELLPHRKPKGGTRYYWMEALLGLRTDDVPTIGSARVSSPDQKADLERQHAALEAYCAAKGWRSYIIKDLGSGMNYRKKGLQELLDLILRRRMRRLVLTHKDRLLRFGAELVFTLCELQGIEIVIIHAGEQPSFEDELAQDELAQDVLEIITVFSARLYGARSQTQQSQTHQRLLETLTGPEIEEQARQLSLV